MNAQLSRAASGARQVILTGGAVLGLVCILVAIGAVVFGLRPLVFRSGSMTPTIGTGALAIAHSTDASDLREGDIVSVENQTGDRVTHRIVAVDRDGQDAILTLKGDANKAPDLAPYRVAEADRVLFSVPRVGYVIGWLTGPFGLFFLGLYAAFLISVILRRPAQPPDDGDVPNDGPRPSGGRRKATRTRGVSTDRAGQRSLRVVVPAVVATFVAGAVAQVSALPTLAAWTDTGAVAGTSLTAYTVPTTTLSCSYGFLSPTFKWGAVPGATSYTLSFTGGTAKGPVSVLAPTVSWTDPTPSANRVVRVVVNREFAGTPAVTWTSVPSNPQREAWVFGWSCP